jgi:NAD(P)-dependent dehydrogenase (short-subunit alcohol dehydrogenase family)
MNRIDSETVVVVTGSSAGIGRAAAIEFGKKGASVALLARGQAGLEGAAEEVRAAGGRALTVPTDVSDQEQVADALEHVEEALGPVDVWVNVAFTSVFGPFDQISPDEYRRVTEVNYLGYVYATMAVLPRMKQRGHGTIVQVGSALAYRGIPLQTAYCGSKHALQGFHESLRCELLHDKSPVKVTMLQMPAVNTPQFSWVLSRMPKHAQPVPPIYQPQVAGKAVVFAAEHPHRREYWVGGSTMGTLAANAIAPGVLDRYLAKTGFSSQQTDAPQGSDQPVNLWEPADSDRDFGTRGAFDSKARGHSSQVWASEHHGLLMAAAVAGVGGTLAAVRSSRSRP